MGIPFTFTGKRFHHLIVIGLSNEWIKTPVKGRPNKRRRKWLCRCDCGNIVSLRGNKVMCGDTKSCGCRGKILLNGEVYDSYAEAFFSLRYKSEIAKKIVLHNVNYPRKKWRCDFFIPSQNTYIEVTAFNENFKRIWKSYLNRIEQKKKYVQDTLKSNFEFHQVELTKENMKQLSVEMGISPSGPWRKIEKGFVSIYKTVDWSLSDSEIATKLGKTVTAVHSSRRLYDKNIKIRNLIDRENFWKSIDWDKSNGELVKESGYSKKAIKLARKRYGHRSKYLNGVSSHLCSTSDSVVSILPRPRTINWEKIDWSLPNRRIAKIYSRSPKTVREARRRHQKIVS